MSDYYNSQIEILDKHNLVYVSLNLPDLRYDQYEGKCVKGKQIGLEGGYMDRRVDKVSFNHQCHNAVAVMTGEFYDGLILVDVDPKMDTHNPKRWTMDVWKALMSEHGLCDTLQSETINGGLHYYFYCTSEQRKLLYTKDIQFKSSTGKMFDTCIDIKYTNQFSYECCLLQTADHVFKYQFVEEFKGVDILPLLDWLYREILLAYAHKLYQSL